MSAIKKGKINWANIKAGKKQQRENDGTGFSLHLEATVWNGKQTGAPPSESSARPPQTQPVGGLGCALGCPSAGPSAARGPNLTVRARPGNIEAVVKVPTGIKHDSNIELV